MRILLVDDHTLFRSALERLLSDFPEVTCVVQAGDGPQALAAFEAKRPDLVIMDLRMPGLSGLEVIREMRRVAPEISILVVTVCDSDYDLVSSIRAGARGYLLKNATPEELRRALLAVCQGEAFIVPSMAARLFRELASPHSPGRPHLTEREHDVLRLLAEGASNADIADQLYISPNTVKCYLSRLLEKLGLMNRIQLAVYAVRAGIADRHLDSGRSETG